MAKSKLYSACRNSNTVAPVNPTTFEKLNLTSENLQEWVNAHPQMLDKNLLVFHKITNEFNGGGKFYEGECDNLSSVGSGLLALNNQGGLVLIFSAVELNNADDAFTVMKWSHYASFLEADEVVSLYTKYLGEEYTSDDAYKALCRHIDAEDLEFISLREPEVMLIVESVSQEVADVFDWCEFRKNSYKRVLVHTGGDDVLFSVRDEGCPLKLVPDYEFRDPYERNLEETCSKWAEKKKLSFPPTIYEAFWKKMYHIVNTQFRHLGALYDMGANHDNFEEFHTNKRMRAKLSLLEDYVMLELKICLREGDHRLVEALGEITSKCSYFEYMTPKPPISNIATVDLGRATLNLSVHDFDTWDEIYDWVYSKFKWMGELDAKLEKFGEWEYYS